MSTLYKKIFLPFNRTKQQQHRPAIHQPTPHSLILKFLGVDDRCSGTKGHGVDESRAGGQDAGPGGTDVGFGDETGGGALGLGLLGGGDRVWGLFLLLALTGGCG